ncbi:unnamed protein product [Cuscuta campestris]|uniref:Uncharacterized protein n=1 Tax=Cuscuta campestris TaxID=132261 RepID=A0A484LVZ3_9ASTE|nr:unnamed protein product [Cuscuta campestris]
MRKTWSMLLHETRWERLIMMRAESSLPLTIELLCSLEVDPSYGSRTLNIHATDSHTTLAFTLLGHVYRLTVGELAGHLGRYTLEETMDQEFHEAPFLFPENVDRVAFWAEHSSNPELFDVMSRASSISVQLVVGEPGAHRLWLFGYATLLVPRECRAHSAGQMLMRDLDVGMLRDAHIRRSLGSSSSESNTASSSTPVTSGASSQPPSRRSHSSSSRRLPSHYIHFSRGANP